MIIKSNASSSFKIMGTQIIPGKFRYKLDTSDPKVIYQLRVLQDSGTLEFDEEFAAANDLLDKAFPQLVKVVKDDNIKQPEEAINIIGGSIDPDSSSGDIPDKATSKSSKRSKMAKRRN